MTVILLITSWNIIVCNDHPYSISINKVVVIDISNMIVDVVDIIEVAVFTTFHITFFYK